MLVLVGDSISVATSGCSGSQFGNFPMSPVVRKCLEEVKTGSPHFSINTLAMRLAAQETKARFGIIWSHAPMGSLAATGHMHQWGPTIFTSGTRYSVTPPVQCGVCLCWASGGVVRVRRTTHDT